MPTENTSLKNTAPAGDSNTSNEMVIGKINTYHRIFLIVAGSLLALFALIAVAGTSSGQHLQSSTHEIAKDAVALADYQVDSANLALTKDVFGLDVIAEKYVAHWLDARDRRACRFCINKCDQCNNCGYYPGDPCLPTNSGNFHGCACHSF